MDKFEELVKALSELHKAWSAGMIGTQTPGESRRRAEGGTIASGERKMNPEHAPNPGEDKKSHKKRIVAAVKAKHPNLSDQHANTAADAAWAHHHGEE